MTSHKFGLFDLPLFLCKAPKTYALVLQNHFSQVESFLLICIFWDNVFFWLFLVVFVNRVCDFNEFKFTEKWVNIIEFTLLGFRSLKLLDYDTLTPQLLFV